jgi:hypothetical protein
MLPQVDPGEERQRVGRRVVLSVANDHEDDLMLTGAGSGDVEEILESSLEGRLLLDPVVLNRVDEFDEPAAETRFSDQKLGRDVPLAEKVTER